MNLKSSFCLILVSLTCYANANTPPTHVPLAPGYELPISEDTNRNGVRDDVDALVATKFSTTPSMARAAHQKATSLQAMVLATTKAQARLAAEKVSRASACVRETLPGADSQEVRVSMAHELESQTVNTRARALAYQKANSLAGGSYFPEPVTPACD